MEVYKYESDVARFRLLNCDDAAVAYLVRTVFDGRPLGPVWEPFEVWWDEGPPDLEGDFPGFTKPVVSGRVVAALGEVLRRHGELLPLRSKDGEFYLYNVTDVVDCLDEAASSGPRLPSGGFMWLNKHVFVPERVAGHLVFKIPQLRRGASEVFVTGEFCRLVAEAGLRGFDPVLVWSERGGPRWWEPFWRGDPGIGQR